jgi:GT2 family glycosyltransferase
MVQQVSDASNALGSQTIPDITILIVNRNSAPYLTPCIESILADTKKISAELILVDGSSTDQSIEVTRKLWPEAKVISVPETLGYVRGNNVGLKQAKGRYTMYLNSDTVIFPGTFQKLIDFMDQNPQAGAVSGTILNPDGSDQGVIRRFPSVMNGLFGRRSVLSRIFPNNRWYKQYMQGRRQDSLEPFETEMLSACSMVVRTQLTRDIGGMDERFRFYWVDGELCCRLARKGNKVYCVPTARVMHYEGKGGSTATFSKRLAMNIAFNEGAYLAYVEYHQLARANPLRLLVKLILTARMLALTILMILRPSKATSSGGRN